MKDSNMPKADFVTSIFLICFGISIVVQSYFMPRFEEIEADPHSAPGIVPAILGVVIIVLSVIVLLKSVKKKGYHLEINTTSLSHFLGDKSTKRLLVTLFISIIYGLALVGNIHFVLASFIYVLSFIILFEYQPSVALTKQWKVVIFAFVQAALVSVIIGAVFRYLFLVDLP
ncbi:MAG: tripartite tricarboxylate transporter TctB family protein [bacterium]